MKTNIKSKAFYKESESMQKGWGKYLRSIDKLKDAVHNMKSINLNDACWILYGEGHCSSTWESFQRYCKNKGLSKQKMPWECWKVMFDNMKTL